MKHIAKFLLIFFLLMTGCTQDNAAVRAAGYLHHPIIISIDSEFNVREEGEIAKAFAAWQQAANGAIRFIPLWNQPKPNKYFRTERPDDNSGVFMWSLNKNDKTQISEKLKAEYDSFDGLFIPGEESGYILIFVRDFSSEHSLLVNDQSDFYAVVLHELGHLLGLDHSTKHNTVMYHKVNSTCITLQDAIELCKLYGCEPQSYCD